MLGTPPAPKLPPLPALRCRRWLGIVSLPAQLTQQFLSACVVIDMVKACQGSGLILLSQPVSLGAELPLLPALRSRRWLGIVSLPAAFDRGFLKYIDVSVSIFGGQCELRGSLEAKSSTAAQGALLPVVGNRLTFCRDQHKSTHSILSDSDHLFVSCAIVERGSIRSAQPGARVWVHLIAATAIVDKDRLTSAD